MAEVDLRVGGGYRLAMHDPGSGDTHVVRGEYTEVVPPERLVYTWTWEHDSPGSAGSVVTVVFRDDGPRTTVQLTHTGFADAAAVARHEHGWQAVMDTLERPRAPASGQMRQRASCGAGRGLRAPAGAAGSWPARGGPP